MKVKTVLMPVTALLLLFVVAPVMAAPATKTPLTAEAKFISGNVSPGRMWTTGGNIVQVKGAISAGTVIGDISGGILFVSDETLDMNTGKAVNHGKFVMTVVGGTFEGSFRGMGIGSSFSGTFVGQGTGTREGQKLMGSFEGTVTYVGVIPNVEMTIEGIILSH